jgi:hypothetical protein
MSTTETLSTALKVQGFELFSNKSSDAKSQAQRNLSGKTHYVDEDTLKFHSARVLSCTVTDNGLLLGILESTATYDGKRVYRPVFFDIFGTVVSRCDLDDASKSAETARKEFWKLANELDAVALTLSALEKRRHDLLRETEQCDAILTASA